MINKVFTVMLTLCIIFTSVPSANAEDGGLIPSSEVYLTGNDLAIEASIPSSDGMSKIYIASYNGDELSRVSVADTPEAGMVTADISLNREYFDAVKLLYWDEDLKPLAPSETYDITAMADTVFPGEENDLALSAANILQDFNNYGSKGIHPRLHAEKDDFARVALEAETNSTKKSIKTSLINAAAWIKEGEWVRSPIEYKIDGGRLLSQSRRMLKHMYVFGMLYQLTGDKQYAIDAWHDLSIVCDSSQFPDWYPPHSLDVGEMTAAVAIAYDWMYDAFTDEQKKIVEEAIYRNSLSFAMDIYENRGDKFSINRTPLIIGDSNWNSVCSSGMTLGALALMDVYPKTCSYIVANTIRGYRNMCYRYAPDGAWYEGPGYMDYVMQYSSKMISSLDSGLGTDYGLADYIGYDKTGDYLLNLQSDTGIFVYGDGMQQRNLCPEIFWLSNKFNRPDLTSALLNISDDFNENTDWEDRVLALLWYDVSIDKSADFTLPLQKKYEDEALILRDSYDKGQTYVGIHAGATNVSHGHLDTGSFVFDSQGVRWAMDLGQDNYNTPHYWEEYTGGRRWQIFTLRAEAHNNLVINPGDNEDMKFESYAPIELVDYNTDCAIATVDMTEPLSDNVSEALRGFYYTDGRKSLVIRDEFSLTEDDLEVHWFMITKADVEIDGNTAILTQNDENGIPKQLKLEFISDIADISITSADAAPVNNNPNINQTESSKAFAVKRIDISGMASGSKHITVKLTPYNLEGGSDINDYNKEISTWSLS